MKIRLPQAPKSSLKFWGIVLGIPVTFILVLIFMFLYQGSTKDIISVANQFQPGEGWSLKSERVTSPRFICLSDVACPSISRSWNFNGQISDSVIQNILSNRTLVNMSQADGCTVYEITNINSCAIDAVYKDYALQIYIQNQSNGSNVQSNLTLFMQKQ